MVFSSLIFTFYFLPVVVILYYIVKEKYRNYLLVIASLIFYAYGEPEYVFLMIFSVIVNYFLGLWIDKMQRKERGKAARNILILDIAFNLLLLFIFKYLRFSLTMINTAAGSEIPLPDIALPIGISFFTFQAMSYCIDVYRKKTGVQKNILYVALYISFFPQLIAGPIVRYNTIEKQITDRKETLEDFSAGVCRFFLGFSKKVIIANNLSVLAADIFSRNTAVTSPALLWIGSIAYSLQIFFDFSGYSDMAIGLGRMFGFKFDENFNYPYISSSITEFWRRWHISLSSWFRDYVYIPLGGSRVSVPRNILNLFIVWLLTGIWHGANTTFLVWGMFYFVMLSFEKWIIKPRNRSKLFLVFWRIVTLVSVNLAWVMFNSNTVGKGFEYIKGMFGLYGNKGQSGAMLVHEIREYAVFLGAAVIFSTPLVKVIKTRLEESRIKGVRTAFGIISPTVLVFLFLWSVSFLILGYHNPFIYFNF
ncbi:MAG: MBOAT family protein [Lachnospiraceae bacterium]|nr:MBOAT family protein [Lachnospiraceae bacterium]